MERHSSFAQIQERLRWDKSHINEYKTQIEHLLSGQDAKVSNSRIFSGDDSVAGWHSQVAAIGTYVGNISVGRLAPLVLVLLLNVSSALVNKNSYTSLSNALLVTQRNVCLARSPWDFAHVRISLLSIQLLLQSLLLIFVDLLFDYILREDLVIELERLLIYQLVVQSLSISRLNYVAFWIDTVLVAFVCRSLVFALELLLLLNSVVMMLYKPFGWRNFKLRDSSVVEFINSLVEGFWVDTCSLGFKLHPKSIKLVLNCFRLYFKLLVVKAMLRFAINSKLLLVAID